MRTNGNKKSKRQKNQRANNSNRYRQNHVMEQGGEGGKQSPIPYTKSVEEHQAEEGEAVKIGRTERATEGDRVPVPPRRVLNPVKDREDWPALTESMERYADQYNEGRKGKGKGKGPYK